MAYIFGGNTNLSYEDIQRKRRVADALLSSMGGSRDVGEGLSAIGKALAIRGINKQTDKADASNREAFNQKWAGLFSAPSQASFAPPPVDPNSPEGIGDATMVALGKAPDYSGLEGKYGLPAGYLARTAQLESGGNPNAQNPNSSAGGAFQFIDSTAAQYGLTDKMDPVASADAAARLARDNKAYLKNALGREPTAAELYLAHQQGAGGAAKLLLSGSAPAETAVSRDAISLNGGAPGMTAQDFASHWTSKFDGGPQPANMSVAQLAEIAGDPYASPGQKALVSALLQQQMQGMDPAYQLDLQLKQAQLEAAKNPQAKPTDDLQEYQFYASQAVSKGEQPASFTEWMRANKAAGAANQTVNVSNGDGTPPDEGELMKALGKKEGEVWASYLEAGGVSAGNLQDFQMLDEIITMAPQGPVSGRLAGAFPGVNSAADAFNSIVKRVAPTLRAPGSGSTSDIEYDGMLKSLPQLSSKPEANAAISAMMKAKAQINIERAEIVRSVQSGEVSITEGRKALSELDSRSIMTPELKAILGGLSPETGSANGVTWSIIE